MSGAIPALATERLKIGYTGKRGAETVVASDLSLTLARGELVCLLGPNGAGKSTLIRSLAGVDELLEGRVELDGKDVGSLSPKERARSASVVLTDSVPTGMFTVYGIVALGRHPHTRWSGRLKERDRERIEWAMTSVGVEAFAERQFEELSDGERQKVLIARALAQESNTLILDEPTAFVDLPRRVELIRILKDLAHRDGMAVLLSSHDLEISIRCADRLWLMESGGEVTCGTPEDLALSGSIERAFASDRIDWDSKQGGFRLQIESTRRARLNGSGDAALWTRRALERKGYAVEEGDDCELEVIVTSLSENPIWRAGVMDTWKTFDSLETMFDWVDERVKEEGVR